MADDPTASPQRAAAPAGSLIELDGTLNLRDLGGWPTASGEHVVARSILFRSDRLSDLSPADHDVLDALGIVTVIDLRHEAEASQHPSLLWSGVENHMSIPMGGEFADQRSFIERALDGDFDDISNADVGASYIEFLTSHATGFGTAIDTLADGGPALFHCTAGKDRTGLLAMLMLRTVGVDDATVLHDFTLSNEYRAERRIAQLEPVFTERGLDIEKFRPALSAPGPALRTAMAWIDETHGSTATYLVESCGVADPIDRLSRRLLQPAHP